MTNEKDKRLNEIFDKHKGSFWLDNVKSGNVIKYKHDRELGTSYRSDYYPL